MSGVNSEAIEGSPCSFVVIMSLVSIPSLMKECPLPIIHVRKLGCLCGHVFDKSKSKQALEAEKKPTGAMTKNQWEKICS